MANAKIIISILFASLFFISLNAQNNSGSINGLLKDSSGKQALSLATITVFVAKDTTIVTYRLSDPSGTFRIPGIPLNITCRVLVSYSGYKTFRKEFLLSRENPQLDMGAIFLTRDSKDLDEVIVYAERPPVSVRKDTIEFNASAFKTLPSALLEDLLKKLPGMDIDADGNIIVKGKRVNKLLVDGKEFFGGDPQVATKNLPANIVDKVQVMNDKEEMERNPDIPESEIGQVVNIKLKKAIKQGWFGKAYAGAGTDNRHEAGAILNAFRDTTQVSVLGYTNNINKPGFGISDIQKIGGFQRSGYNSMMVMSDGGFALNDISFGGTGQGLQRSTGGGINFNNQYGKKVTLNLQYFYGQIKSDFNTLSNQQRFFKDSILSTRSKSNAENINGSQRIGATITWKMDSLTTITIRPGVTLTTNRNSSEGNGVTEGNYRGKINNSNVVNKGSGNTNNYSLNVFLIRNFKKRGRSVSINTDFSSIDNNNDNYTDGLYSTYNNGMPADSLVNQLRHTGGDNLRSNSYISFSEPVSKKFTLRITENVQYLNQNNDIDFLNKNIQNGKYDQYNHDFSNSIERNGWKNTSTASLSFRFKKFSITPGINYLTASFNNYFTKNPTVNQSFNYIYPSLNASWGPVSIYYQSYIQEAQATDLQKVIDISNRFYQQFGNPDLKPSYSKTLSINVNKYDQKSGSSYSAYISASSVNDAVIREITIDQNAFQTTRPVNVDGTYRGNASLNYNYQYKFNKDYKFNIRPGLYGNINKTIISVNGNRGKQNNLSITPQLSLGINYKDKIEFNQRYAKSYRQTTYGNISSYKNIYVRTHSVESEVVIRMPKHVVWENLINYTYNPQVAQGIRKSVVRWNAGVNYLFLKEDKGQLKLSVYDLLNQNINVYRFAGENYISDTQNTTLTRYFMLTFTYNLRNFTGGKVGGKDRSMFFF